ncbi:hypothetical protein [Lysinibacillus xylanilyticus]|uniref:hypothetical protein n=1 Tax=Lysinibacillus xylanilyticus TaxID=582475 RepID=UPI003D04BFE3
MRSRKMKLPSTIILILELIISSCYFVVAVLASNKETSTTFVGENNNWSVTVDVNNKGDIAEGTYVAKYKGNNIENLLEKVISYQVNYKSTSSGGSTYLSDKGVLEGKAFRKSCGNGCPYSTIDVPELAFKVVVDGIEDRIILQKNE